MSTQWIKNTGTVPDCEWVEVWLRNKHQAIRESSALDFAITGAPTDIIAYKPLQLSEPYVERLRWTADHATVYEFGQIFCGFDTQEQASAVAEALNSLEEQP